MKVKYKGEENYVNVVPLAAVLFLFINWLFILEVFYTTLILYRNSIWQQLLEKR